MVDRQFLPVNKHAASLHGGGVPRMSKTSKPGFSFEKPGFQRGKSMRLGILVLVASSTAFAADPPVQPLWSGRLADKPAVAKIKPASNETAAREPDWLRRMDKNDRATLTGGWALQNWSGGTQSITSAGDRDGPYAPNTYQGGQFQPWNNVSNRQEIPSWNDSVPSFPRQMWSQGYVSPNTYFGADAQTWGNMSSGMSRPNMLSGGWSYGR